jgi:hypothetical protein
MTPKEKAKELTLKFMKIDSDSEKFDEFEMKLFYAQRCALIAVDEIIDALEKYDELTEKHLKDEFNVTYFSCELQNMDSDFRYWNKVKQEIEKL